MRGRVPAGVYRPRQKVLGAVALAHDDQGRHADVLQGAGWPAAPRAGEREHGSLEPLLATPAPRGVIAAGKWLAASAASMMAVGSTTVLSVVVLGYIPLQKIGIRFRLDSGQLGALMLAVLPVCPGERAVKKQESELALADQGIADDRHAARGHGPTELDQQPVIA